MKRRTQGILLGMFTGILGILASLIPFVLALDENAGLDLLFNLRGPRIPPDDVVVVSIDKLSADALDLPAEPASWPRSYHADLINRLTEAGAAVIVLDIFFKEPRDASNTAALARAIQAAGNVVLFEYTKKEITRLYDAGGNAAGELLTQRLVPPVAPIADAALALAPFPLPVFPVKVSQFWTFTPVTGDLPTVPVVALQLYASSVYPELLELVAGVAPEQTRIAMHIGSGPTVNQSIVDTIQSLRTTFSEHPALGKHLPARPSAGAASGQHRLLRALIRLYSSPDSRYLNFYGPPQTITTVPYVQVLQPEHAVFRTRPPVDLRGKTVFVGYSERLQPERLDEFYTVFSQPNGLHLSGVEISATAFANLLDDIPVTPLPMPVHFLLLLGWGILIGVLARLLPAFPAVAITIALAGLYLGFSHLVFSQSATWPPLVVPLLLQAPLALFAAILWHYLEVHREREGIRTTFGYYLPPAVVDRLASDMAGGRAEGQLMYGTCLYTDAEHYTALSEGMTPEALTSLMNSYYESLFQPVRRHNGIISDVVGDAMLAIWASRTPEAGVRRNAIEAALEIDLTIPGPYQKGAPHLLPTRLGLHTGQIMLGSIGAMDHYEYRAVGDIVNTANRIQGLNKVLGTRALLSQEVLEGIDGFQTREVGTFLLSGKTHSLVLHELIGAGETGSEQSGIDGLFAQGLAAFRRADWNMATEIFTTLVDSLDGDGPSRYYLDLCLRYQENPPGGDWRGIIRVETK